MITKKKQYVYCLSAGQYSDYQETWYVHEQKLNESKIKQLLSEHIDAAKQLAAEREQQRIDECEELFGQRKWPRGSTWMSPAEIAWEMAGFEPLVADFEKYCDYIPDQIRRWCGLEKDE